MGSSRAVLEDAVLERSQERTVQDEDDLQFHDVSVLSFSRVSFGVMMACSRAIIGKGRCRGI